MRARSSVRLSLYAGLTSLFAAILYQAVESFIELSAADKIHAIQVVAIVSVGILLVIEPLLSRIKISGPESPAFERHEGLWVRLLSLAVIVLVSCCEGLLHHYLNEALGPRGVVSIEQLVFSLIGPSAITFCWIRGTSKRPRRAGRYGLCAGVVVGVFFLIVDCVYLYGAIHQRTPVPAELGLIGVAVAYLLAGILFLWPIVTSYAASGFLGGFAADRGWGRRAWQGIAIGLGLAAVVEQVFIILALAWLYKATAFGLFSWAVVLEPVSVNIGWALGFVLVPEADVIFRGEPMEPLNADKF